MVGIYIAGAGFLVAWGAILWGLTVGPMRQWRRRAEVAEAEAWRLLGLRVRVDVLDVGPVLDVSLEQAERMARADTGDDPYHTPVVGGAGLLAEHPMGPGVVAFYIDGHRFL